MLHLWFSSLRVEASELCKLGLQPTFSVSFQFQLLSLSLCVSAWNDVYVHLFYIFHARVSDIRCCTDCVKDLRGCCCPNCTTAPRLRPVLPGHQRYQKWHIYRDSELHSKLTSWSTNIILNVLFHGALDFFWCFGKKGNSWRAWFLLILSIMLFACCIKSLY